MEALYSALRNIMSSILKPTHNQKRKKLKTVKVHVKNQVEFRAVTSIL